MGIDVKDVLRRAKHDIQHLRRRNEILEAKAEVVEVFKAALLGPNRANVGFLEGMDVIHRIEGAIKELSEPQEPMVTTQKDLDRGTNTPGDCGQ